LGFSQEIESPVVSRFVFTLQPTAEVLFSASLNGSPRSEETSLTPVVSFGISPLGAVALASDSSMRDGFDSVSSSVACSAL
jgi:hypothetical protein